MTVSNRQGFNPVVGRTGEAGGRAGGELVSPTGLDALWIRIDRWFPVDGTRRAVSSREGNAPRKPMVRKDWVCGPASYWTVLDQAEVSPDSKPSSNMAGLPIVKLC